MQKLSFLALRVLGSLIFINAGLNHLFSTAGATARLKEADLSYLAIWIAPAEILIILSGIGLLLGGFMLLAGFRTKLAALLLLLILIPITLTIQVASAAGTGPLFKNIALIGMLFFFIVNGARYYALDQVFDFKNKLRLKRKPVRAGAMAAILTAGLLTLLSACTASGPAAQTAAAPASADTGKKNYAVLISQPNHLKAAANTAEAITPASQYKRENFVVMACAKSVEGFVKGHAMAAEITKGKAAGATYKVCGMSLQQFQIDPATLVEGVEIIPNGLTYMFDLQQQGYVTVEL